MATSQFWASEKKNSFTLWGHRTRGRGNSAAFENGTLGTHSHGVWKVNLAGFATYRGPFGGLLYIFLWSDTRGAYGDSSRATEHCRRLSLEKTPLAQFSAYNPTIVSPRQKLVALPHITMKPGRACPLKKSLQSTRSLLFWQLHRLQPCVCPNLVYGTDGATCHREVAIRQHTINQIN